MIKFILKGIAFIFFLNPFLSFAQKVSPEEARLFTLLRKEFIADNAYKTVGYVEQRWRIAGNSGFNESIFHVEKILKDAGFVKETASEKEAALTYRIETRPMQRPTWEPINAQLFIIGESLPLLEFKTNRNMLASYSGSTGSGGVTAELIDIGKGTEKDFEGKDLKGKILLGDGGIGSIYTKAMASGAIGALSYSLPAYTQPTKHQNSIQFSGIRPGTDSTQRNKWGIILSYAAKEKLKTALAKGAVSLKVVTEAKTYPSEELTIVANVRGSVSPDERFVFSAHVQEPGANDNATGVGTLAEMARITAGLVRSKQLNPQRTITFLWGDEIISTGRYIRDDSIRAKGIRWGLSLDMVGEDVAKTGGSFLIEKMPDPSAIWTRGIEKHTAWGGSVLKESDMFPHYFNDFLLNRCLVESEATGWVVNTNPFEGGSDHTPFLRAKIPGLLMWHFTDVFYHTDGDRLDMVSAEEMKHVGVSALATAILLTSSDARTAIELVHGITSKAVARINTELALGKEAVQKGGDVLKEKHIIEVWRDWYVAAIEKTGDIPVKDGGTPMKLAISSDVKKVQSVAEKAIAELH